MGWCRDRSTNKEISRGGYGAGIVQPAGRSVGWWDGAGIGQPAGRSVGRWDGAGIGQPAGRSVGVVGRCRDRSTSVEISRGGGMVQRYINQHGDQ